MCAQYILDSVLYWAEEYHIDGFRFDLMGLMDVPLMDRLRRELDRRWGRGEKLILGEPWSAAETNAVPGTVLADKGHLANLDVQVSAFCDDTRDAVKGDLWSEDAAGFVNGGGLDAERLACCVKGWAGCTEGGAKAPSQTVNYLSCHDDWTLWDRLVMTGDPERRFRLCPPELLRQNRLAAAVNFTCQGHLFFLSGEEFARTKGGVKNTYASPVEVNRLDWSRAWENRELVEYYRGLLALRMRLPGLRDKTPEAAKRLLAVTVPAEDCGAVLVDNRGEGGPWKRLFMAYSAAKEEVSLPLPRGDWEILADARSSFAWREPRVVRDAAVLEPVSALILGQR